MIIKTKCIELSWTSDPTNNDSPIADIINTELVKNRQILSSSIAVVNASKLSKNLRVTNSQTCSSTILEEAESAIYNRKT